MSEGIQLPIHYKLCFRPVEKVIKRNIDVVALPRFVCFCRLCDVRYYFIWFRLHILTDERRVFARIYGGQNDAYMKTDEIIKHRTRKQGVYLCGLNVVFYGCASVGFFLGQRHTQILLIRQIECGVIE